MLTYDFSIIIPTWNNLPYLQKCLESIEKHSSCNNQVIVFINEGKDGTSEWVKENTGNDVDFISSIENLGICHAVNRARKLVKSEHIIYMNDDMYVLPEWDIIIKKEIEEIKSKDFMLSSTLIEPIDTGNPCVIVSDYGSSIDEFQEDLLLKQYDDLVKDDWMGSSWPPVVLHKDKWDEIGGFSIEFSPGMYSDPDLAHKLLETGVRYFKGLGSSKVYHFGSKTTRRLKTSKGRKIFINKWMTSPGNFRKYIMRMGQAFSGPLKNISYPMHIRLVNWIKYSLTK